jgi:hypothetical protein
MRGLGEGLQTEAAGLGAHSQVGHAAVAVACHTLPVAMPLAVLRVPPGDGASEVGGAARVALFEPKGDAAVWVGRVGR